MSSPKPFAPRPRPVFHGQTYMAPRYHSRRWPRLLFVLLIVALAVIIAGAGGLYWEVHRAQGSGSSGFAFHVSSGDTVNSVADRLQSRRLIDNSLLFRLDARVQGLGGALKAGDYTLRHNMSIDQMVAALGVYHAPTVAVTIPEGRRIPEIAAILQSKGVDPRSFLQEAEHPDPAYLNASILKGKPAAATLEGYLFPDTYLVAPHSSGKEFAKGMVGELDQKFTPAMRRSLRQQGRTVFQALTLASIVEREARVESERPTIAGVYANRLRNGWYLDADPTVQFAAGTPGHWWPVLRTTAANVASTSPYNTYTHYGLPPGPISNPGLLSIEAAVHPAKTKYMYFLHIPHSNGHHAFAVTEQQQIANEQKYGSG